MDNRLIFLYHLSSVGVRFRSLGVTKKAKPTPWMDERGQARRRGLQANPETRQLREAMGVERQKWPKPSFQEKLQRQARRVTVLKLTQVGEEKILRRSREPSLRNSAN